jgi:dTDP-4-amino-4,6-dideoxygalactose transaminase
MTFGGVTKQMASDRSGLVSVLLPCGDRPHAVAHYAIPSVLAQTHGDWELVVVSERADNARMRAAVAQFNDPRIRYEEITGTRAGAFDRARELARGAVLSVLDEDSEYLPGHLRASLDALADDDADVVYCAAAFCDPNTGERSEVNFDPAGVAAGRDVPHPAAISFTSAWGDESGEGSTWAALFGKGARLAVVDAANVVSRGDDVTGRVRVSMPSLPPTERLHELVDEIASSRRLSNHGPLNAALEQGLAEYIGARHVITAASGDTALGMAMIFAANQRSDRTEVVLPSYTFPSTVNSVVRAGLVPVFCDVEPDNLCASAATMAPMITDRTLALSPVLAHGAPCDMAAIEDLARDCGAFLITDAAAALGATIGDRKVGTYGDMEMFSLSSTKVLSAGEGGFLSLHDDEAEARLREIGRYGLDETFSCVAAGVNGRLAEWPAGLALAGIDLLDGWLAARRRTATIYEEGLADLKHLRVVPHRQADRVGTAKDVVLVVESPRLRDELADRLLRNRIETRPYFRPVHVMAPFKHLVRTPLEVTDQFADCMLSLPITNELPQSTAEYVIGVLRDELEDLTAGA